jgi:hypothetical protein
MYIHVDDVARGVDPGRIETGTDLKHGLAEDQTFDGTTHIVLKVWNLFEF